MKMSTRAHTMRRVAAVVATCLALGTVGATAGSAGAKRSDTIGSDGVGDSYYPRYGNGGYDVSHYDIRLQYDPATDKLWGQTTVLAKATQDLTRFNLDFGLTVESVTVNGWPASHTTANEHELVITPARTIAKGQRITTVVRYEGIPSTVKINGFTSWKRTGDGALAVNEPEIANWWFPSNDHPTDKATYDVSIGVPNGVEAISNGVQARPPAPYRPGWTRWSWRSTKPAQTYMAFLAIGQYDITTDTAPDGKPVLNAISERLGDSTDAARASIDQTVEIAGWASTVFGEYPFESYGGVAGPSDGIGFALETQTRPVYGYRFWTGGSNHYVVTHELAHQWYGDAVALEDWKNIWLHEGFASYAEWLYSEHIGEGTAQELFDFNYDRIPATDPFWQVKPGDPGAANQFAGAVYTRGALTLHQLRVKIGDELFFKLLKDFVADHRYGNSSNADFQAAAEEISGQDLDELFDTWLYTPGKPSLEGKAARLADRTPAKPASFDKIVAGEAHGH